MNARLLLPTLLLAAACGGSEPTPLDARSAALMADANFRRVAVELGGAVAFLQETRFGEPLDAEGSAEALADFLRDRIFTAANVEAEDGTSVTFLLRPEIVCEAADEACIQQLSTLPLRLRATSDEPGDLDVAVLVGADRLHPLDIALHAETFELQADLGALRDLVTLLGASDQGLPTVMEGRLGLGIARHAAGDFTASLSILEAVAIHGDGSWDLTLGRAIPAIAARVQEAEKRTSVRLGLAALSLRGPIAALLGSDETATPGGTLGVFLPGLTGEAIIEGLGGTADVLRLVDIGLGDGTTVVDVDGTKVLEIDLNPLAGRAFDLIATADESGTELHFAPSFDLGLGFFFGDAVDHFEVPAWALDELLRIRIDGAEVPRMRLADAALDGTTRLEMLDGVLTLESDSLPTVQIEAGMCLLEDEAAADHPFAGLQRSSCG